MAQPYVHMFNFFLSDKISVQPWCDWGPLWQQRARPTSWLFIRVIEGADRLASNHLPWRVWPDWSITSENTVTWTHQSVIVLRGDTSTPPPVSHLQSSEFHPHDRVTESNPVCLYTPIIAKVTAQTSLAAYMSFNLFFFFNLIMLYYQHCQ